MTGITKQAVHQYDQRQELFDTQVSDLLIQVDELREEHPGCGVAKMHETLRPDFIGRDRFVEIFMELGYRVKRVKNYVRTTIPTHLKYPNLIEGLYVYKPNQVWQSDITYFYLNGRFYYIVFILDVYTRKILGYNVSENLRAESNIKALKMAIKSRNGLSLRGMIHHSDRGSQYVDKLYLELLAEYGIEVSMGLKAQDNAYAERINGTIKNEYLKRWEIKSFCDLKVKLTKAVNHYNNKRLHDSLPKGLSPVNFEKSLIDLNDQKRPKVIIYADGKNKIGKALSLPDFRPEEDPLVHICPIG
jgi:transposase InsO family protein